MQGGDAQRFAPELAGVSALSGRLFLAAFLVESHVAAFGAVFDRYGFYPSLSVAAPHHIDISFMHLFELLIGAANDPYPESRFPQPVSITYASWNDITVGVT